jgi:hypothetical protein
MSIFFFEKYAHFVVAYPKPRNQVMDFYWSSFYMAPDANTKGFSLTSFARSCRSGLTQSLAMLSMYFYWSIDIMAPDAIASGSWLSRAYLCLRQRLAHSHCLHFVQAPLNTRIKKAPHFCEAL